MSDDFCPRQIQFTLAGNPGVMITATEDGAGAIDFIVDVVNGAATADLRALFFHFTESKLSNLTVSGGDGYLTEYRVKANSILDLGDGATLAGAVKKGFDVGIEWGTAGAKKDDLSDPLHFKLSRPQGDLTLDDIAKQQFGAKLDAVGGPGGPRSGATKLTGEAPSAPDAKADTINAFEDGAAGLNSPSKLAQAITLNVLANDTDGDGDALIITSLHTETPINGTLEISADGKSILYTPLTDFSGQISFEYCVSDGNGGQDSAVCTVNIAAVADDPLISFVVTPTADVNVFDLTVTADQNDADGSEGLSSLEVANAGSLPAGASISAGVVDGSSTAGHLVKTFTVTTAVETDFNFNIDFTAVAQEASNADTESETKSKLIDINYTNTASNLTYQVTDQSIWDTGDEWTYHADPFLGVSFGTSGSGGDDLITQTNYSYSLNVRTGFEGLIDLNGGQIDAEIPVELTIDTTYNKTTDQLLINPSAILGAGLSFNTTSPSGQIKLDFVFTVTGHAFAEILGFDVVNEPINYDKTVNIFDLNSDALHFSWDILPGIVDLQFDFPDVTTANVGGSSTSSGSDAFLTATLDVDQAAAVFIPPLAILDSNPLDDDNFEVLDVDLIGSLSLAQNFAIDLATQNVTLVFDEDGTTQLLDLSQPLVLNNVGVHDVNKDGAIEMHFEFSPRVTLTNDTEIESDLSLYLAFIKNLDVLGTIYENTFPITGGDLDIFNDTFDLAGVGSQTVNFVG